MRKEIKTLVYDEELRLEAYRFEGMSKPFPNHFHDYYVIGLIEKGSAAYGAETGNTQSGQAASCCSIPATPTPAFRQTAAP